MCRVLVFFVCIDYNESPAIFFSEVNRPMRSISLQRSTSLHHLAFHFFHHRNLFLLSIHSSRSFTSNQILERSPSWITGKIPLYINARMLASLLPKYLALSLMVSRRVGLSILMPDFLLLFLVCSIAM